MRRTQPACVADGTNAEYLGCDKPMLLVIGTINSYGKRAQTPTC